MTDTPDDNRKTIELDENDVVLVFKEDGHVDLSFPEVTGDYVPDHIMAALALSYAVIDEEFFGLIQERFAQEAAETLEDEAQRNRNSAAEKETVTTPHLKVVS